MENSLNTLNQQGKAFVKDPFNQKGGVFGIVVLAFVGMLVVFNIDTIYNFAQNLLGAVLCFVATAIVLYVAFDKKFRFAISTWYMLQIRRLLSVIIKMDPISILKDTIEKMYKRVAQMEDSMGKLRGVCMNLKDKIKEKKRAMQDCSDRAKAAEKLGEREVAAVEKRQFARLTELVETYTNLSNSAETWYAGLDKLAKNTKLYVQDAENEIAAQEERYSITKKAYSSFKSAMSVLQGDPDELARYNMAFDFVNEDIINKVGEMDRVLNSAGGMLSKIDVDNEMFSIKGEDLMSKYQELGIEGMFKSLEQPPISFNSLIKNGLPVNEGETVILPRTNYQGTSTTDSTKIGTGGGKYF